MSTAIIVRRSAPSSHLERLPLLVLEHLRDVLGLLHQDALQGFLAHPEIAEDFEGEAAVALVGGTII